MIQLLLNKTTPPFSFYLCLRLTSPNFAAFTVSEKSSNITFLPGLNIENPMYTGSLKASTLTNCEDIDEIHLGLHCL